MKNEKFEILTDRDHIRKRANMYVGSPSFDEGERFVKGEWRSIKYVPALNKIIDEIIDNTVDEAIRTNFKKANKVELSIEGNRVTVTDNGRGIPQDKIKDNNTGTEIPRPLAAWTKTKAGTSFDDNRTTIGANGVGSACCNFLSNEFVGTTWQNGSKFTLTCVDGANEIKSKTTSCPKKSSGTSVSFTPDFSLFEADSLDDFDTKELVEDRLINLQMAFPEISFYYNGKRIDVSNFKQYTNLFLSGDDEAVVQQKDNLSFFFAPSTDGFRQNSFVNGVNTRLGGSYVEYVVNGVIDELMIQVKKRHKIDVAKSTFKNGFSFVMFVRGFTNPKFDSQTKERQGNTLSEVKSHYENSGNIGFKQIATKIINAPSIIDPIIESQLAKKEAADRRAAKAAQKKAKRAKVPKHVAANGKDTTLFIMEGDSAMSPFLEVRDTTKAGAYPLRGVIKNTYNMSAADVFKNKELTELVSVLGLDINNPESYLDMQYKEIALLTDSDHDGIGHIAPLLICFFYQFWPKLFKERRVHMTRSPIMISTNGKETKWFYTYEDANSFKDEKSSKGYKHRYIKGLASLQLPEYDEIINNPVYATIDIDDPSWFEIMFGKDSQMRKDVLQNEFADVV